VPFERVPLLHTVEVRQFRALSRGTARCERRLLGERAVVGSSGSGSCGSAEGIRAGDAPAVAIRRYSAEPSPIGRAPGRIAWDRSETSHPLRTTRHSLFSERVRASFQQHRSLVKCPAHRGICHVPRHRVQPRYQPRGLRREARCRGESLHPLVQYGGDVISGAEFPHCDDLRQHVEDVDAA
jgi:hypothetical protein